MLGVDNKEDNALDAYEKDNALRRHAKNHRMLDRNGKKMVYS